MELAGFGRCLQIKWWMKSSITGWIASYPRMAHVASSTKWSQWSNFHLMTCTWFVTKQVKWLVRSSSLLSLRRVVHLVRPRSSLHNMPSSWLHELFFSYVDSKLFRIVLSLVTTEILHQRLSDSGQLDSSFAICGYRFFKNSKGFFFQGVSTEYSSQWCRMSPICKS